MSNPLFAIVPVEVLSDRRLSLEQIRVLIALLSFRAKNTDLVWPGREALAERCGGMHLANISSATSALVKLGWLEKDGNGGRSQSCIYRITVPDLEKLSTSKAETVAESARVSGKTVAESATQTSETVAESANKTVAESARGIEQTREHTNKSNILSSESAREVGDLVELEVPEELARQWVEIRRGVEQRMTLVEVKREADSAGITMRKAVEECIARRWSSFKASWYARLQETSARPPVVNQQAPPWWAPTDIERLTKASDGVKWWVSAELTDEMADQIGELRIQPGETLGVYLDRLREKLMAQWRAKVAGSTGTGG